MVFTFVVHHLAKLWNFFTLCPLITVLIYIFDNNNCQEISVDDLTVLRRYFGAGLSLCGFVVYNTDRFMFSLVLIFVFVFFFFQCFSIVITSFGEERAGLCASHCT